MITFSELRRHREKGGRFERHLPSLRAEIQFTDSITVTVTVTVPSPFTGTVQFACDLISQYQLIVGKRTIYLAIIHS